MAFDRNSLPVQLVEPHVLHGSSFSVGEDKALPVSSVCAWPNSFKIVDARLVAVRHLPIHLGDLTRSGAVSVMKL